MPKENRRREKSSHGVQRQDLMSLNSFVISEQYKVMENNSGRELLLTTLTIKFYFIFFFGARSRVTCQQRSGKNLIHILKYIMCELEGTERSCEVRK